MFDILNKQVRFTFLFYIFFIFIGNLFSKPTHSIYNPANLCFANSTNQLIANTRLGDVINKVEIKETKEQLINEQKNVNELKNEYEALQKKYNKDFNKLKNELREKCENKDVLDILSGDKIGKLSEVLTDEYSEFKEQAEKLEKLNKEKNEKLNEYNKAKNEIVSKAFIKFIKEIKDKKKLNDPVRNAISLGSIFDFWTSQEWSAELGDNYFYNCVARNLFSRADRQQDATEYFNQVIDSTVESNYEFGDIVRVGKVNMKGSEYIHISDYVLASQEELRDKTKKPYSLQKDMNKYVLSRSPGVLFIALKRFTLNPLGGSGIKHFGEAEIPEKLEINDYNDGKVNYKLKGANFHIGASIDEGHYKAVVIDKKGIYWLYNDSLVNELSEENKETFLKRGIIQGDGYSYLVVYEREGELRKEKTKKIKKESKKEEKIVRKQVAFKDLCEKYEKINPSERWIIRVIQNWEDINKNDKEKFLKYIKNAAKDSIEARVKGGTPLHWAAYKGNERVVKALLKNSNIDINEKDKKGNTPLHLAAREANKAMVKILLEKGADPTIKNKKGKTPRKLAKKFYKAGKSLDIGVFLKKKEKEIKKLGKEKTKQKNRRKRINELSELKTEIEGRLKERAEPAALPPKPKPRPKVEYKLSDPIKKLIKNTEILNRFNKHNFRINTISDFLEKKSNIDLNSGLFGVELYLEILDAHKKVKNLREKEK
ncbi:hypothetical protein GF385_00650 [Candidatus Dependentiae bacterium]|nr:hypothetical protein [Candidatus Dependentiae bacterium]